MSNNTGTLFLIPTVISAGTEELAVPAAVRHRLGGIRHFLAEDIRTARRYLSSLNIYGRIEDLGFAVLNKDTAEADLDELFKPVFDGHDLGVLSESGCPGIADPGALAVKFAHGKGIKVVPLVGPSAILLALMASGLNGQRFAFHGYLPIKRKEAAKAIRELERESRTRQQTQIFIETPYRNNQLFATLVQTLAPDTAMCVAVDLTGENESVQTLPVMTWREKTIELPKRPAVFLFLAQT